MNNENKNPLVQPPATLNAEQLFAEQNSHTERAGNRAWSEDNPSVGTKPGETARPSEHPRLSTRQLEAAEHISNVLDSRHTSFH